MRPTLAVLVAAFLLLSPGASRADEPPPGGFDPVEVRLRLLAEMDRSIREAAAKAHLDARIALDRTMPLAYVGIDAEPKDGVMEVTKVYGGTGASAAGLRAGDLLVLVSGDPTPSKAALGRAIRRHPVGTTLRLVVRRADGETEVPVVLGKRPEEDEDEAEQFPGVLGEPAPAETASWSFDADAEGASPQGLEAFRWGHGDPADWVVVREGDLRFLRQRAADPTGIRFPMAVARDFVAEDAVVRVRYRLRAGEQDRAAGLVLRWQDAANYLVARVNASERDLRIFRVADGLRRTLPGARAEVPADDGGWHVLEFRAEGPRLSATVDGAVGVTSYDTWFGAGRAGTWTKSDSVTDFDDLSVAPTTE